MANTSAVLMLQPLVYIFATYITIYQGKEQTY